MSKKDKLDCSTAVEFGQLAYDLGFIVTPPREQITGAAAESTQAEVTLTESTTAQLVQETAPTIPVTVKVELVVNAIGCTCQHCGFKWVHTGENRRGIPRRDDLVRKYKIGNRWANRYRRSKPVLCPGCGVVDWRKGDAASEKELERMQSASERKQQMVLKASARLQRRLERVARSEERKRKKLSGE